MKNTEVPEVNEIERATPFSLALEALLNRYNQETASNTPDFILAEYLGRCLAAYNLAVQQREDWRTTE